MFLEASEMNMEALMGLLEAGAAKLYSGPAVAKWAAAAEKWFFKAEAGKAGWKFPEVAEGAAWAVA